MVVVVGWVAATPLTLRHPRVVQRVGYALIGPAQRLFEHVDFSPGEYTEKDISPYFWHNGRYPTLPSTRLCEPTASPTTGCTSAAWSPNPVELPLSAGYDAVVELGLTWWPYGWLVYFHLLLDALAAAGHVASSLTPVAVSSTVASEITGVLRRAVS